MNGPVPANGRQDHAPSIGGVALGAGVSALGYAALVLSAQSAEQTLLAEAARSWFQFIESGARAAGLSVLLGDSADARARAHLLAFSVLATAFALWITRSYHRSWAYRLAARLRAQHGDRITRVLIEIGRAQCVLGLLAIVALLAFPTVHGRWYALLVAPLATSAGNYLILHGLALDALRDG